MKLKKIHSVVVAALLAVGSVGLAGPANAAINPNNCSVAQHGKAAWAYCAPGPGQSGFYRAIAKCEVNVFGNITVRYEYGNMVAPGQTSKADCGDSFNVSMTWKGISFS
jgi:hypothetical protein